MIAFQCRLDLFDFIVVVAALEQRRRASVEQGDHVGMHLKRGRRDHARYRTFDEVLYRFGFALAGGQ